MKLIDRLVIKEIMGPWLFGVGLFTSLIMAGTYLNRLAGFIADQVPAGIILQLTGLLVPAILVKTFAMAVLLAALLSFGRLSSDSEIVALRAGGASVVRIVMPVIAFSALIAIFTFGFSELVVPYAARRSVQLTEQIVRETETKAAMPVAQEVVEGGKLRAFITAENVNPGTQALQGVTLIAYDEAGQKSFVMFAKELVFQGVDNWKVQGGARIYTMDFQSYIDVEDAWPQQLRQMRTTFEELLANGPPDFDIQSMAQLKARIDRAKEVGNMTPDRIRNFEYGYWNKISVPLAAIIFGSLGAVLGIRNHRTGTAAGFAMALGIIFGYVTLANFMNVWAQGGTIPPYVASFAPLAVGLVCSVIIMWRRNG